MSLQIMKTTDQELCSRAWREVEEKVIGSVESDSKQDVRFCLFTSLIG